MAEQKEEIKEVVLDNLVWASNQAKLHRAVKECKDKGYPITEAKLKELYVLYGGLVLEGHEAQELEERKEVFLRRRKAKK